MKWPTYDICNGLLIWKGCHLSSYKILQVHITNLHPDILIFLRLPIPKKVDVLHVAVDRLACHEFGTDRTAELRRLDDLAFAGCLVSVVQKALALMTEGATMLMVGELRLRRVLLAALGARELKGRQMKPSFWR